VASAGLQAVKRSFHFTLTQVAQEKLQRLALTFLVLLMVLFAGGMFGRLIVRSLSGLTGKLPS
jgi:hypothetical protein